jgi:hypothetical protein
LIDGKAVTLESQATNIKGVLELEKSFGSSKVMIGLGKHKTRG